MQGISALGDVNGLVNDHIPDGRVPQHHQEMGSEVSGDQGNPLDQPLVSAVLVLYRGSISFYLSY